MGGLYLGRRFNGEFFALPGWGAYIWRGLFSEFYGICLLVLILHDNHYIMNTASNRVKRQLLWKAGFEINCLVQVASGD